MKALAAMLIAGLLSPCASATIQERDTIAIDGKVEVMDVYPLEPWLVRHPGALPESGIWSTNRFRGYAAHWILLGGRLELARVNEEFAGPRVPVEAATLKPDTQDGEPGAPLTPADTESVEISIPVDRDVLPILFPGRARVIADWYSGTLVIPQGATLHAAAGFAGTRLHAHYLLVIIEQGREVKRVRLDGMQYDAYRRARFRRYQQTPQYAAAMRELAEHGWSAADATANVYGDRLEEYISLEPLDQR